MRSYVILTIILFVLNHQSTAQSEDRALLAHYPLMGDLTDLTGNHDTLSIENITVLDSAVYSDGANSFSDTANRINGWFPQLDHDDVYLSLDFKLDSIPDDQLNRSILVGGGGWRWLAASYLQRTGEISFRYNNWKIAPGRFKFEYDTWYHLALTYQRANQTGKMLIDGEVIAVDTFDMDAANDRSVVLDCFCGFHAMGGYWKNLKIYGPDTTVMALDTMPMDTTVLDTTMSNDSLFVECRIENQISTDQAEDGTIKLAINGGTAPYTISTTVAGEPWVHELDATETLVEFLPAGAYLFSVLDSSGLRDTCSITLLPPQTDLPLISHFPLTTDGHDLLGTHADIELTNVPLDATKGIFSPNHIDRDSFSQAKVLLSSLDLDDFYISLEINLDSIEDAVGRDKRSIFVLGQGWRELAPVYNQSQKTFALNVNNWQETSGSAPLDYDRWYEVAASYSKDDGLVKLFIDREQIVSDSVILETNNDRSFVLWCNCGPSPLQGYWRNLRIYTTSDSTTSIFRPSATVIQLYPNPVIDILHLRPPPPALSDSMLRIYNAAGQIVLERRHPPNNLVQIDVQDLEAGFYFLKIGTATARFIKK